MSKCCCNNDVKFFKKPNAGICDVCQPAENKLSPIEEVAMCPPIGEPRLLTMMAPAVFDECGVNLCRTVCVDELTDVCRQDTNDCTEILFDGICKRDLVEADKLQLQVVDINFNFVDPCTCRYSEIRPAKNNPNLSRITLKDIDVTFAVSAIDCSCRVFKQGMMTVRFLGPEQEDAYDSCTNPSSITFDLYTPYGVAYGVENPEGCNRLVPTINYMGYVSNDNFCYDNGSYFTANNTIQQGVSAQALAKVIAYDNECFAIGLSIYFKSIYFVQYRFQHAGLTIPPKLVAVEEANNNNCLDFVCGDLLEPSIQPLEVGRDSKTICDSGRNNNNCCDTGCSCAKTSCAKGACNKGAAIN